MKKLLFALAAVPLLAAGCSMSGSGSVTPPEQDQAAPTAEKAKTEVKANMDVKVNSADDGVNLLEKGAIDEKAKASEGDDSDVTASDSAELNGYANVSNGY